MGSTPIRPYVRKYFETHPEFKIWRKDLIDYVTKESGTEPTIAGVLHAVNQLIKDGQPIEPVDRGHSWIYHNKKTDDKTKSASRKLFELVGETKTGAMILEDEQGSVIVVKPIEV